MKKTTHLMVIFATLMVLVWACNKDDGQQQKDPDPVAEPVQKSSAKQMISFRFAGIDTDGISVDISAEIDEQASAITATMPSGTDITALEPTVEISPKATLEPKGTQDFTSPINYTVTAEDGTSKTYLVTLTVLLSQKEILLLISAANPGNTLNWNENDNINDWEEVVLDGNGNITELHVDEKVLTNLPPEVGQLSNLIELEIYGNALSSIPPEIGQLSNLIELDLWGNILNSIPSEIGQLTNLTELYLSRNALSSIPPEIGQLGSLEDLDLYGNNLGTLPPEIGQLTNLTELDLSNNSLSSIPPEIGQLANLQELYLDENSLSALPMEITQLVNLRRLDLRENNLSQFNYVPFISSGPITLGCSTETNLETLYLAGNVDLEVLDECICNLDLDLGGTVNIDVVPDGIKCVGDVIAGKR